MASEIVQGCWIDAFELSHYRGRRRRLFGPSAYPSIRSRNAVWGISIDSLIVGPQAYVRLYNQDDPKTTLLWLIPWQSIGDVVDLRIDDSTDSLEILQQSPKPGQVGYENYLTVLKAASQKQN
jgi:hypothetical protein